MIKGGSSFSLIYLKGEFGISSDFHLKQVKEKNQQLLKRKQIFFLLTGIPSNCIKQLSYIGLHIIAWG